MQAVNGCFEAILKEVANYNEMFQRSTISRGELSGICWTTTPDFRGALQKQLELVVNTTSAATNPISAGPLFNQLASLGKHLLDGYRNELAGNLIGPGVDAQYAEVRAWVVRAFYVHPSLSSHAYSLAERYEFFEALVELCERDGDMTRLKRYGRQYGRDFNTCKYGWYMEHGQRAKLFEQSADQSVAVRDFLGAHDHLSWLHHVKSGMFDAAYDVLTGLAQDSLRADRRHTLLCLGKLSLFAAGSPDALQKVGKCNAGIDLLANQRLISEETWNSSDVPEDPAKPLSATRVIELLTHCSSSGSPDRLDQLSAACDMLIDFHIDDSNTARLSYSVLLSAILADVDLWTKEVSADREPENQVRTSHLYRLLSGLSGFSQDSGEETLFRRLVKSQQLLVEAPELAVLRRANPGLSRHLALAFELASDDTDDYR